MTSRTRKAGMLAAAVAATALAFGGAATHVAPVLASPAAADTDDKYNPANTTVSGHSSSTKFTVGGVLTVTCTNSVAGGHTPAAGLGMFAISPLPVFNDGTGQPCTDSAGATDTTVTSGPWKIGFVDKRNDETTEPGAGDKMKVIVPKAGAVVTNSFGCTITVAPSAAFTVTGTYDDVSTFTVAITNLPIKVTGGGICPVNATTSTFNGTYTFSPGISDAS